METCLVTGANGFVGRHVCAALADAGHAVRAAVRAPLAEGDELERYGPVYCMGDIGAATDWSAAFVGASCVVHLANRAHVMREELADPLPLYRRINAAGTIRLAEQAAATGVRRFIYVSSVKVMGESAADGPVRDTAPPAPSDPYALSKWEAEQALRGVAAATGMEVTVLRPPLVYGPGVGANFLRLMRWVAKGVPLPLAAVRNRRSLIYVGNLASCIEACARHPAAAGKAYLVSDGSAVSTARLVAGLAAALDVPDRSWPLPPALLTLIANVFGKGEIVRRLVESFEVDDGAIRRELGWAPPYSFPAALRLTADWYRTLG